MQSESGYSLPADGWEGVQAAFAKYCPGGVYNETAGNIRRGFREIEGYLAQHPEWATVCWAGFIFGDIGPLEAHLAWLESARDDEVYEIGEVLDRWSRDRIS